MDDADLQAITKLIWPDGDSLEGKQVHWLLDGARDPDIASLLRSGGLEYTCLFTGPLHPRLQAAAPYLVHLSAGSPTTNRLLMRGWGQAWGILTVADANVTLTQQRIHLKKFLRVQNEQGQILAFRFYDPRVLNVYLPTCTTEEFRTFVGPISRLIVESRGGACARIFEFENDAMHSREYPLAAPGTAETANSYGPQQHIRHG